MMEREPQHNGRTLGSGWKSPSGRNDANPTPWTTGEVAYLAPVPAVAARLSPSNALRLHYMYRLQSCMDNPYSVAYAAARISRSQVDTLDNPCAYAVRGCRGHKGWWDASAWRTGRRVWQVGRAGCGCRHCGRGRTAAAHCLNCVWPNSCQPAARPSPPARATCSNRTGRACAPAADWRCAGDGSRRRPPSAPATGSPTLRGSTTSPPACARRRQIDRRMVSYM